MMTPASAASLTKRFVASTMREGAKRKRELSTAHLPADHGAQVDAGAAQALLVPAEADDPPPAVLVDELDRVDPLAQPVDGGGVTFGLVSREHVDDRAQAVDAAA